MKSTAKATEKRSRTVVVLAIAVALMLLGSIFAQMFNTSFYKVKVSRISFDTDSGTLSGLLYMPKGVDVQPAPHHRDHPRLPEQCRDAGRDRHRDVPPRLCRAGTGYV